MLKVEGCAGRQLVTEAIACDLVVVGGGLAGVGAAVTAARAGLQVTLLQDRPVLGGNASSEVRLWILGATSHMGNNNRWAREGGFIDELLVENLYRNAEGNPFALDALLLEKVVSEPRIRLLLNTAVYEVSKHDPDTIAAVRAFCPQNSTRYDVSAPLFCDASGDGIVGFLAGAAFRMGAEAAAEFGEGMAPAQATNELLGHSLYFYSKDVGQPVKFVPPSFALGDITRIPRFRSFNARDFGCRLWWIEYGGLLDTVHATEQIKWELWRVVYGVWNYIKNSGNFPEAENLTLEWVGSIPGKRESRRFEGDFMLSQRDLVEQRRHDDAVSFGGWAIDLHPAEGVFSAQPGCAQWHTQGVYQIPYRALYSRNIRNLFLAGRIISASHVAFGSTRVMATCAHGGQAVGAAAALCRQEDIQPADLLRPERMRRLQRDLIRSGQFIPHVSLDDADDLARRATVTASSVFRLDRLPADGSTQSLTNSWAMMLPLAAGAAPHVICTVDVQRPTDLVAQLRISQRAENHTPNVVLAERRLSLREGPSQALCLDFGVAVPQACYGFICLLSNGEVAVHTSSRRVTGVVAVCQQMNPAVAKSSRQEPTPGMGIDALEFWMPLRRPGGKNFAIAVTPALAVFGPENAVNGWNRPTRQPNAWVAAPDDPHPTLTLCWDQPQAIGRVELAFDTDFDHPLESVLMGHPERVVPFCVQRYRLRDGAGTLLAACDDNHQTRNTIRLPAPVTTDRLVLELDHPGPAAPAALLEIRCYG